MDKYVVVVEIDGQPSVLLRTDGPDRICVEWQAGGERWFDKPAGAKWFAIRTSGVGQAYDSREAAEAAGTEIFGEAQDNA